MILLGGSWLSVFPFFRDLGFSSTINPLPSSILIQVWCQFFTSHFSYFLLLFFQRRRRLTVVSHSLIPPSFSFKFSREEKKDVTYLKERETLCYHHHTTGVNGSFTVKGLRLLPDTCVVCRHTVRRKFDTISSLINVLLIYYSTPLLTLNYDWWPP